MTNSYHVSVKEIAAAQGARPINEQAIEFEAQSHDDLHDIVARARLLGVFDEDTAAAFAVGLKLFGGVLLAHRDHPLFAQFAPHFGEFMRTLKGKGGRDRA